MIGRFRLPGPVPESAAGPSLDHWRCATCSKAWRIPGTAPDRSSRFARSFGKPPVVLDVRKIRFAAAATGYSVRVLRLAPEAARRNAPEAVPTWTHAVAARFSWFPFAEPTALSLCRLFVELRSLRSTAPGQRASRNVSRVAVFRRSDAAAPLF